jgi:hypothetical protein
LRPINWLSSVVWFAAHDPATEERTLLGCKAHPKSTSGNGLAPAGEERKRSPPRCSEAPRGDGAGRCAANTKA